jgi:hypothetical protein
VLEENVRNVDLDVIERDEMTHVEDDILFHVCLDRRLRSENVVNEGKDQTVKG